MESLETQTARNTASADPSQNILEIDNFSKSFGKFKAVDSLSMTIRAGEAVAFIGQNGAGKSTTMRCIAGLSCIDSGAMRICGNDVATAPLPARSQLGYVPQDLALYRFLTGREYLTLIGKIRAIPAGDLEKQIRNLLAVCGLEQAENQLIREYSGGMARKVAMAGAFIGNPKLVVLDESFVGLDPESTYQLGAYLKDYCRNGGAILISSHILDMLHALCTRFFILHHGKCIADILKTDLDAILSNDPQTPNITAYYLKQTGQDALLHAASQI